MAQINAYSEKTTPVSTDEYILQETSGGTTKKITHSNFLKVIQAEVDDIVANPVLPIGHFYGLEISNNTTDAEHDIDIAAGRARDSSNSVDLILSSAFIKQIDATWAVGTNAGGLDTGTVAADTPYYLFLIEKDSDSSIDVLISASKTSPTMPAGYTNKRRIRGGIFTDGSANILAFKQFADRFYYDAIIEDYDGNGSTTAFDLAVSCPVGMIIMINGQCSDSASEDTYLYSTALTDPTLSTNYNTSITSINQNSNRTPLYIPVDSSGNIRVRSTGAHSIALYTIGFIDEDY